MPRKKMILKSRTLVLVEGKDEVNFLSKLLENLGFKAQVEDICGKDLFPTENGFAAIKQLEGFENVKSLAVIRDADYGENAVKRAFQSVKTVLERNGVASPSAPGEFIENDGLKIGIYIMPDCENEGMLEDLCLKSVENDSVFKCANQFLDCVNASVHKNEKPKNLSKAKAQTFLAGKKEVANATGVGAQKGYWNFEHECMNKIKQFLENLR
ncbi:MAG: DUF3226 domain-containing protein [bacterium]